MQNLCIPSCTSLISSYITKTNFLGYSRTKNQSQRPSTRRHHNYEAQELLSIFQRDPLQAMTFVQDRARNSCCSSRHRSSVASQSVPGQELVTGFFGMFFLLLLWQKRHNLQAQVWLLRSLLYTN